MEIALRLWNALGLDLSHLVFTFVSFCYVVDLCGFNTTLDSIRVWWVLVFWWCHHLQSSRLLHREAFSFWNPYFRRKRKLEKMSGQAVPGRWPGNTNSRTKSHHCQLWNPIWKYIETNWLTWEKNTAYLRDSDLWILTVQCPYISTVRIRHPHWLQHRETTHTSIHGFVFHV